jgi:hypothetical protein
MSDDSNVDETEEARRFQFSVPGSPYARPPEVVLPRGPYPRGSTKDRAGNRGG